MNHGEHQSPGIPLKSPFQPPENWNWRHALVANLVMDGLQFILANLVGAFRKNAALDPAEIKRYYRTQRRPSFSPPSWVFLPAWTFNRVLASVAALRVLNLPAGAPGRRSYLVLQVFSWLDFTAWTAATFALRSTVNVFVLTALFLVFTSASIFVAVFRLKDTKVALLLASLLIWLLLATAVSYKLLLWNRDEFYRVGPFRQPGKDELSAP
ncbi:MAG TPA: TspO/MBR family protein [Chthoniobacterales bacterium]